MDNAPVADPTRVVVPVGKKAKRGRRPVPIQHVRCPYRGCRVPVDEFTTTGQLRERDPDAVLSRHVENQHPEETSLHRALTGQRPQPKSREFTGWGIGDPDTVRVLGMHRSGVVTGPVVVTR